jgi:L-amino acid N-acyltransferase YncA
MTLGAQIRDATTADADVCAAIYAPYVTDTVISFEAEPPTPADMSERITEALRTHSWLVAEWEGGVVGYAYGHPFASRTAYRWSCETAIYIDHAHRGIGIGRALYSALLERLASRGYRLAIAGVTLPNDASVGLHRYVGYEPIGVYRHVGWKNDAWHDVAWFQKDLGVVGAPPGELR